MHTQGDPPRRRRTGHAITRKAEGRPVGTAYNDAQKSRQRDVFVQPDGRYIVRAPRGREHIFAPDGVHITTVRRSRRAHETKIIRAERHPITRETFEKFKEFFK